MTCPPSAALFLLCPPLSFPLWAENPRRIKAAMSTMGSGALQFICINTHTHTRAFSARTQQDGAFVCLCDREREICPPTHPSVTEWCRTKCPPPYNTVTHHSHCPARLPPPLRGHIPLLSPPCATYTHTCPSSHLHTSPLCCLTPSVLSVSSPAALTFLSPLPHLFSFSLICCL